MLKFDILSSTGIHSSIVSEKHNCLKSVIQKQFSDRGHNAWGSTEPPAILHINVSSNVGLRNYNEHMTRP